VREPSFTQPQIAIAIAFAVIAVLLAAFFTFVAVRTRRDVEFEEVRTVGYRIRPWWFAFLAVLLTTGVVVSLFLLPYSQARGHVEVMRVSGGQFYWSIAPRSVPAGTRVRFDVTGVDVNHALGLYGPDGNLLGVVQAMPGYTNRLEMRLEDPGSYLVACLEFCGIGHHRMFRTFQVTGAVG
jgi:cytochrome c oxidase subunit 2